MRTVQGSAFRALRAVQAFLDANATALAGVVSSGARKRLDDVIVALDGHAGLQSGSNLAARSATQTQRALREALLRDHMAPIAKIAASELPDSPELEPLRLPLGDPSPERLWALATGMAAAAAQHADVFTTAGLPPDFAAQLNTAADAMLASVDQREQSRATRIGATQGIKTLLSTGRKIVHALDALVKSVLKSDPPLLAAWLVAKRVKLVPGGQPASDPTPPAPTPPPAGPTLAAA